MRVRFVLVLLIIILLSVSIVNAQESRNWKNFPGMGSSHNGKNCADALLDYGITTTTTTWGYFPFYRSVKESNFPGTTQFENGKSLYICAEAGDHNPPSEIIAWNGDPDTSPAINFPSWEGSYCATQQDAINPAILNGDYTISCYASGVYNQYADYRCNDGIDNDLDGQIDMADSLCTGPTDDNEGIPTTSCGAGEFQCYRMVSETTNAVNSCLDSDFVDECFQVGGDFLYANNVGAYNYAALSSDTMCCPLSSGSEVVEGCVYDGVVYSEGDFHSGLGSDEDQVSYCYYDAWVDLDDGQASGNPDWLCSDIGSYQWVYSGESNVGEYDNTWTRECCGDDDREHYAPYCPGVSSGGRKCCSSSNDRINEDGDCVPLSECAFCYGNYPFSGDYSDIDVFRKHSVEWLVTGGSISTSYDDCNPSNNRLTEYYCSGIERKSTSRDCTETNSAGNDINAPTGAVCYDDSDHSSTRDTCVCPDGEQWLSDRRCGKPCTDDNDDDEYLTQETISYKFVGDSGPTKTDECTSYSDVKEYFCTSDSSYSSVTKDCNKINAEGDEVSYETGAMCGGGKCICPSGEEWLSDGTCGIPCGSGYDGSNFFRAVVGASGPEVFKVDRDGKIIMGGQIIASSTGPSGSFLLKNRFGNVMAAFDSSGNIHVPGTWQEGHNMGTVPKVGFFVNGRDGDMVIDGAGNLYTAGCVHEFKDALGNSDGAYKCRDYYRTHSGNADSLCPKLSESFLEIVNGYNQY